MFLQSSSGSPADTAAKLLQTAAARRLKGTTHSSKTSVLGGAVEGLTGVLGGLLGRTLELVSDGFHACTSWLGRRGRLIVTAIAGLAVLAFLTSRLLSWEPRDTTRLRQVEVLWEQVDANDAGALPAEVSQQLDAVHRDLEESLRDQPVSGTSGSGRMSALARRDLLFAVRMMREPQASDDDPTRDRIEASIEAARDTLSGSSPGVADASAEAKPQGRWSTEIIAIVILDVVLAVVLAGWWVFSRRG
jgi:hypothetical protein